MIHRSDTACDGTTVAGTVLGPRKRVLTGRPRAAVSTADGFEADNSAGIVSRGVVG